jgi:arylsulfatase A-like enzyme
MKNIPPFLLVLLASLHLHAQPPNVLVIFSDDHTQQTISAYRSKLMQTPHIDRIAREGALFNNVFVTNSICAPSRAVLLTRKYSHVNGLKHNGPNRFFNPDQQQIQKILAQKNYQTAWIDKWHLQTLPNGFNHWKVLPDQGNYFQPDFIGMNKDTTRYEGYVTDLISDFSLEWLIKRDQQKPFFWSLVKKRHTAIGCPIQKTWQSLKTSNFLFLKTFLMDMINARQQPTRTCPIPKPC